MKRLHYLLALVCAAMCITSCDPKLDFDNIDPSAKLDMALALPIGDFKATVGDFLTDTTIKGLQIDENGVYMYVDTFKLKREFHAIDLTNYISETSKTLHVAEALTGGPGTLPAGTPVELRFPLGIKLNGVNTDTDSERLDKMVIDSARFSSSFYPENFGLQESDIKHLWLELPDNFTYAGGNRVEIPLAGYTYGGNQPINLYDFTLNLMKNPSATPAGNNVVDSITFYLVFDVQPSSDVTVGSNAKIHYYFNVQFLEYAAVYGFFKESNKMHEDDTVRIVDYFPGWANFKDLRLPISDPKIDIFLTHSIGAPLWARIDTFATFDEDTHEMRRSKFGSDYYYEQALTKWVQLNDPYETTVTEKLNTFDKNNGEMDRLFQVRPDQIYYKYSLSTYQRPGVYQHRLTKNTNVEIAAALTVPFKLNEGTELSYSDTADVNIDQYSIDSLIAEVEMIESLDVRDITLVLTAESTLPFDVDASVMFLDENYNVMDLKLTEKGNEIKIAGLAGRTKTGVLTPGRSIITVKADQALLDKLTTAKHIVYRATIADMVDNANVNYPVEINTDTFLKLKVGVAADVSAYLKLEFNNK